ncbi:MAG: sigma-70 family RNA polymerase sigma factor [Planctomycetota bacterium]|jgi:RNA polymerase sigma-70 factor (ECF subfamily)
MEPYDENDPVDLQRRLTAGDKQALAALFSLHRESLRKMVQFRLDNRLRHRVDAEDILQEAFLAAEQRIHSYRDDSERSVFVWLRLIVGQTLVDVHRRHLGTKMRDANQEVSLRHNGSPMASSATLSGHLLGHLTSPSQAAMRAEMVVLLEEVLDNMDDLDKEVLVLRHFEELSNNEVAAILGIQKSAASNRYVRALQRLKGILTGVPGILDADSGQL